MRLGANLRELTSSKLGLTISSIVALVVAAQVTFSISLIPPGFERRSVDIGSASTHVLVDTPQSTLTDLRQDIYEIRSLSQRAVILGNIMTSSPVRDFIAKRAGVPADQIAAVGPLTPDQPHAITAAGNERRTTDILKRPNEYRLSIQANPTVPVLDVYAEAPNTAAATKLANGAVDGLRDYLDVVADKRGTPAEDRVQLEQLGRARGGVINGAGLAIAVVVFVLVFAASCAGVLLATRIRRGWVASKQGQQAGIRRSVVTGK